MTGLLVRRLGPGDVGDYLTIRLAALRTAPEAFGSTHAVEAAMPASAHEDRLANSVVFGAYAGGRIVGMAAFKRETGPKTAHKGFVWGVFVDPAHRGGGVGGALMEAVLAEARRTVEQLILTIVEGNEAALALYRRLGFTTYGKEPRALKAEGGYADEVLMALVFEGMG